MAVTHGHGNPDWTRDETILALDLYFDCGGKIPSGTDKRVQELSRLLRSLPYHVRAARKASFRNPDGVAFKLQNIRQVATGKGLSNVSKMDRVVWEEFGDNPEATEQHAELIKAGIEISDLAEDDPDEDVEFAEGRVATEAHKRRERNPKLRKKLLHKKRKLGPLVCEICGCIEPASPFGEAIFEAHHVLPLAAGSERRTKLSDLALLCANCHRMLHRAISAKRQWIDMPEASVFLKQPQKPNKSVQATAPNAGSNL
jgi:5-methylcytosine-specific restriction protein A